VPALHTNRMLQRLRGVIETYYTRRKVLGAVARCKIKISIEVV